MQRFQVRFNPYSVDQRLNIIKLFDRRVLRNQAVDEAALLEVRGFSRPFLSKDPLQSARAILIKPEMSALVQRSLDDVEFIKSHLADWLVEQSLGKPLVVYEIELRERIVRVEEELRHQREAIQLHSHQMDKRFEQMDKRLDQVDKRFEQMSQRFDDSNRRLELLVTRVDRFMFWSLGLTIAVGALVIAALKLLA